MPVMTVRGPVPGAALGSTLPTSTSSSTSSG